MDAPVNKVAQSGLVTLDPANFYPGEEVVVFDLKPFLFMELILKEKDFREALKNLNTEEFANKIVTITCTADAIIPVWAYMLAVTKLQPVARQVFTGTKEQTETAIALKNIAAINTDEYKNAKLVIKGCGDLPIADAVYTELTRVLLPIAQSIMYGEPCSTVPVYKKKKEEN
jgi:Protein of unknown function (DUF2480)